MPDIRLSSDSAASYHGTRLVSDVALAPTVRKARAIMPARNTAVSTHGSMMMVVAARITYMAITTANGGIRYPIQPAGRRRQPTENQMPGSSRMLRAMRGDLALQET